VTYKHAFNFVEFIYGTLQILFIASSNLDHFINPIANNCTSTKSSHLLRVINPIPVETFCESALVVRGPFMEVLPILKAICIIENTFKVVIYLLILKGSITLASFRRRINNCHLRNSQFPSPPSVGLAAIRLHGC